jgi:hypothetical protein
MLCELECEVVEMRERKEERRWEIQPRWSRRTRDLTLFQTSIEEIVPLLT